MGVKRSRRAYALLAAVLLVVIGSTGLAASLAQAEQPVSPLLMGMYGGYDDPLAMQRVREVGAAAMRVYVEWNLLQPYEYYNTSDSLEASARAAFERQLRNVSDAGLTPIVLIGEAPPWASPRPRGPLLPDKLPSYVRFVELLVRTYSVAPYNVHYWELWPEPDAIDSIPQTVISRYGDDILKRRAWGDHGAEYAAMLKAVYPAIKRADPTAQVLNGAIAYDWFGRNCPDFNCGGIFNYRFINDVIAAGGACCFDILAFNSYAAFAPGWEEHEPSSARDIAAKTSYLRSELQRLGVAKPMMVMEVGFWSQGGPVPTRLSDGSIALLQPSPERHAAYLAKTYIRAASVGLQAVAWYTFRDQAYDSDKRGIVTESLEPKPAYFTYRQIAEHLRAATYLSPLQPTQVGASAGEVEGHLFLRRDGRRVAVLWLEGTLSGEIDVQFRFPSDGMVIAYDQTGGLAAAPRVAGDLVTLRVSTTPVFVVDRPAGHRLSLPIVAKAR